MNVGTKTGTLLLCLFAVCSSISAIDSNESEQWLARCRAAGLPILHIETVDSVMPTCEEIAAPEGCFGRGIINNEKVPGQLWIEIDGDTLYDSGAFVNKKSGITIKVRGNTSATAPGNDGDKKPYKIKLQKKADLLLRGDDDTYADKDWVLLRYVLNETLAGNMTNRALHMPWTPAEEVVLLMLNGDFRGLYILTESIERNQTCRIDVSKEGFIYEYDAYWWNEDYSISSVFNPSMKYTFKYPDVEDLTDEQKEYLNEYIPALEQAYLTKDAIDDLVDATSYARWLWVHDMLGDWDSAGSNPFIIKYDAESTSKTALSCVWDFGGCFTDKQDKAWSRQHSFWCFYYFFALPHKSFIDEYIRLYDEVVKDAFDAVAEELDDLRQSPLGTAMDAGVELDNERWNVNRIPATEKQAELSAFLRNRKEDVADLMEALKDQYAPQHTAIESVITSEEPASYFDVLGRQIDESTSGIVIMRYPDGTTLKKLAR